MFDWYELIAVAVAAIAGWFTRSITSKPRARD